MTTTPRRCLRAGCPNPKADPDRVGLGLCEPHNRQLADGTIGTGHDPTSREVPVARAQELLADIAAPTESVRSVAARTGLSKDLVHHVRRGTWAHVRSKAWEQLQNVHADEMHARRTAPTTPKQRPLAPLPDFQPIPEGWCQLALFDPSKPPETDAA